MTKKLYDLNAYDKEFDAKVIKCEKVEDGRFNVELDETLFFPEEGGQTPDKGILNGVNVLDVQINGDVITHTVDGELKEDLEVHGVIDWKHRFNNMQQHSGEHIFSGIVNSRYGYDNVGFHLSDSVVTMDYNGSLTMEQLLDIERDVNKAIFENVDILVSYPNDAELKSIDYRSKKEIDGQVRIVTIPGYDICACCAPHVKKTGEIGLLKVVGMQNYKGGVRVSILCGYRALELWDYEHMEFGNIAAYMSTSTDKVMENIKKLQSEMSDVKEKLTKANEQLIEYKIQEIPASDENVVMFEDMADSNVMRKTVNLLMEQHKGYNAFFAGDDQTGYRYIIGSKENDCKEFLKKLSEIISIKGGGSGAMVQGSLSGISREEITNAMNKAWN